MKQEKRILFLDAVYEFFKREKKILKLESRHRGSGYREELEHIRYWQKQGHIEVVPDSHTIDGIKICGTPLGRKFIKDNQ